MCPFCGCWTKRVRCSDEPHGADHLPGKSKQEAHDTGMRLLPAAGLAEKALICPDELSGGQRQHITIART